MARRPYIIFSLLLMALVFACVQMGCEGKTEKKIIHAPPPPGTGTVTQTGTGSATDTGTGPITGTGTGTGTGSGTDTGTVTDTGTGPGHAAGDVIIDASAYPSGSVVGQHFGVPILIDTGIYKMAEYAIEITYDPTKLSVFAVQAGPNSGWDPLVKNFSTAGSVKLSGTNEDALAAYSGTVDICEITFEAIEAADPTTLTGTVKQIKGQDVYAGADVLIFYDIGAPGERPITPVSLVISSP